MSYPNYLIYLAIPSFLINSLFEYLTFPCPDELNIHTETQSHRQRHRRVIYWSHTLRRSVELEKYRKKPIKYVNIFPELYISFAIHISKCLQTNLKLDTTKSRWWYNLRKVLKQCYIYTESGLWPDRTISDTTFKKKKMHLSFWFNEIRSRHISF